MTELSTVYKNQKKYFETGETLVVSNRLDQLRLLDTMLRDNEEILLSSLTLDLGKAPEESYLSELGLVYQSLQLTLKKTQKWSQRQRKKTPLYLWPGKSWTQAMPYGQTLIINAFNYPLLLSLDPLVGAVSAGNVAMVALSERTPNFNAVLTKLSQQYLNSNWIYFYEGNKERNQLLLTERFDKIFFTGSATVGKSILKAASQHLTPVTLELGGKSPALITQTADIKRAAQRVAWGKFLNVGQTCVAPDYCLVPKESVELFKSELIKETEKMYGKNPFSSEDYGRLVNSQTVERLARLIEEDNSFVVYGGEVKASEKYIGPTVIQAEITQPLASMKEELFGPILPVMTYETLEEALDFIRSGESPLAFYPFVGERSEESLLLNAVQFGGATINDTILHLANHHLPFGGVGQSGMGSYHGIQSFKEFSHEKAVLKRQPKFILPIMSAPYSKRKDSLIRKFLK
ncbi:aldehyde dehydrogenase family protein [Vagococcus coleopterorum]|uniref:Aldehyde dehydrogenase n=1 Tax=Vagococcus coleopterorum TaxID=2714946 RepID=A0A6G8AMA1_9ENTE|nr:aldehyde dehydrogenase family protein [Vagococcus coleopterorum]QIL46100.1 aldehyde dehydrogenase family protein [Vagococcus coleopterorum]